MTQPALFAAPTRAPHPGSACCDPTQDLPGWIRAQRARIARDWRWSRIWRARGNRTIRTPGGQPRWRASQVRPAAARYRAARIAAPLGVPTAVALRIPAALR